MKIELVQFEADEAMHQHSEIGVRVESDDPLGPWDWGQVWPHLSSGEQELLGVVTGPYIGPMSATGRPCKFDIDQEHDDDPDAAGYAQWWFFPKVR